MKRILVPLDGSRLSEAVLPLVETLAAGHQSDLLLVQALQSRSSADAEVASQQEAEAYLAGMTAGLQAAGLPHVGWKVWYDEPGKAIADAARYSAADLVAMSTHGRGGLGRLLFGSVAESLVRQAPVPVLLVRGELTCTPEAMTRILVPLDGSTLSEGVLRAVESLAGPFDLAVDLLQVVEPIPSPAMVELPPAAQDMLDLRTVEAARHLEKVAARLGSKGFRVWTEVRRGMAVDTITSFARETGASLIAMTTHGRSGLGRLLVGSVAERVLRTAPVPVLLWRAPAEA